MHLRKPLGEATIITNTIANNLRFPGQYFDEESGLHYNYFRDYDPATGRYIQSDPIGLGGGISTYGYALQSPVMYFDPDGEAVWFGPLIWQAVRWAGTQAARGAVGNAARTGARSAAPRFAPPLVTPMASEDDNVYPFPAIPGESSQKSKKDRCIERCSDSTLPTNDNGFSFWNCVNRCMEEPDDCE
ncbi:RHS repeat-associated core domain-containing protein [bacterium SCSIO 12696]|nr:RHS repeat-associated core domain-containing protein [bacterium SCSIO 12696]